MQRPSRMPRRTARGFSLVELMIAVGLGLLVLAGMVTLFTQNSNAQSETEKANRQIENARFAIDTISADLRNAGFYGELDPTTLPDPVALPDPCSTLPSDIKSALALHVQGYDGGTSLSCISDLKSGTDVLVVRHTSTTCVTDPAATPALSCADTAAGGPVFQSSDCNGATELQSSNSNNWYGVSANSATLTLHKRDCVTIAPIRTLETHIYFIANNDNAGDHIPTLKRAEIGAGGFTVVPLVEGVENLQIEYGMDNDAPGSAGGGGVDTFDAAPGTVARWRTVVAAKVYVLARNLQVTPGYVDSKAYNMGMVAGGGSINMIGAASDGYKRHLFQGTVTLANPTGRRMP